MEPDYSSRVNLAFEELNKTPYDSLYITNLSNIRWLTGFAGSTAMVLINREKLILFVDSRYREYIASLPSVALTEVDAVIYESARTKISSVLELVLGDVLAVDQEISASEYLSIKELSEIEVELAESSIIHQLRLTKDSYELDKTMQALSIAEQAFTSFEEEFYTCSETWTEKKIQQKLDSEMIRLGADRPGFDTIVASGINSAKPHSTPTSKLIEPGDLVIIDWGAEVDGYRSDTSRTIWLGDLADQSKEMYHAVQQALMVGIEAIAVGQTYGAVMGAAKSVLAECGFDQYIEHPFGHNVGLEIHELPFFSEREDTPISSGAVLAYEPAVYIPGLGGVRLENMIYVDEQGTQILNNLGYQE